MSMDYCKSNTAYPSLSPPSTLNIVAAQVILKEARVSSFVFEQEKEGKKQFPLNNTTKQKPGYLKYLTFPHIYPPTSDLPALNLSKDKRDFLYTPPQIQSKEK